jgi:streptogramin lyase
MGLVDFMDVGIGPDGEFYVIAASLNGVCRFDPGTGAFIDFFVPNECAGIANLVGMAFGPDGHLYLVGGGLNGMWRFDGLT